MNRKHKAIVKFSAVILSVCVLVAAIIFGVSIYAGGNIDFKNDDMLFEAAKSGSATTFYYDSSGEFTTELEKYIPTRYAEAFLGSERKCWYSYDEVSEYLKKGFVAMEDRGFWQHSGVDFKRTASAALNYITRTDSSFGGSTITQQVVKNVSGDNERTITRKFNEIIRAFHIENTRSKEEIFELYMNIVPMGEGMVGVGVASRTYFAKEPSELSIAEAATLIGITNAPTRYNPYKNREACLKKRNTVLKVMLDTDVISDDEYEKAISEELKPTPKEESDTIISSWFVETVFDDLISDLTSKCGFSREAARILIMKGGLSVYTTVDPALQNMLEEYFENTDNFPDECDKGLEYSMVINDSEKSALRAVVGSVGKKKENRGVNYSAAVRTPGSVLKPIALYAPLINDGRISWSTVFDDSPISFKKSSDGEFIEYPRNYPEIYDGLTTVSDALRVSKNTVAVRLYDILGAEGIYDSLKYDFGLKHLVKSTKNKTGDKVSDLAPSPLALGQLSYGTSLRELTDAYTVFSGEGNLQKGRSYIAVYDKDGNLLIDNKYDEKRIFSPECARVMSQLLSLVVESGTASKISLNNVVDTAGKTGTSGNDIDRWFIGYTPYYTAGIWCGYKNKDRSVGNHERNHLKIWDEVMKLVHEEKIGYSETNKSFCTEGLIYAPYCKDSGKLLSGACEYDPRGERIAYGYFIRGTEPKESCDRHVLCEYDILTGSIRRCDEVKENALLISLLDIPKREFPKEIRITDEDYAYKSDNEEDNPK